MNYSLLRYAIMRHYFLALVGTLRKKLKDIWFAVLMRNWKLKSPLCLILEMTLIWIQTLQSLEKNTMAIIPFSSYSCVAFFNEKMSFQLDVCKYLWESWKSSWQSKVYYSICHICHNDRRFFRVLLPTSKRDFRSFQLKRMWVKKWTSFWSCQLMFHSLQKMR